MQKNPLTGPTPAKSVSGPNKRLNSSLRHGKTPMLTYGEGRFDRRWTKGGNQKT